MDIEEVKRYYEYRGMKWPDLKEAIDFAITELAGEALDAYIRTHQSGWTRNNPNKDANLGHELADAYQMLMIAAHEATGKSLETLLREKWETKGFSETNDLRPE